MAVHKSTLLALLVGFLCVLSGEGRRLEQVTITEETNNGRQRVRIQDGNNRIESTARSVGSGTVIATASSSNVPGTPRARAAAVEVNRGVVTGVGASLTPNPAPRQSGNGRATVTTTGSGTATGSGRVTTTTRTETSVPQAPEEVSEEPEAAQEVTEEPSEVEPEETTEEVTEEVTEEPEPVKTPEPVKAPEPVEVTEEEPAEPEPVKPAEPLVVEPSTPVKEAPVEEESEESESTEEPVVIPPKMPEQEETEDAEVDSKVVEVAGKSGSEVCLTRDTSSLEELLDGGYQVTILSPTRHGYEITRMVRHGYATSQTTIVVGKVPASVQKLCNYDPETEPVSAKHDDLDSQPPTNVLKNLCESSLVLDFSRLLHLCWDAGYLTFVDLALLH